MLNPTLPFTVWVPKKPDQWRGHYQLLEGGASLINLSLMLLYEQHLFGRNRWTASNEGFDLVKYRGTSFTFWPHPTLDYIVWWERDFESTSFMHYRRLHPAVALLEKNHLIMRSVSRGGRRKKRIFIPPPSTFQNGWTFMDQFCDVKVLILGITWINLDNPFLHGQAAPRIPIGHYITSAADPKQDRLKDYAVPGEITDTTWMETDGTAAYYSWHWDDGENNKVAVYKKGASDNHIYDFQGVPYWLAFFGAGYDYLPQGYYAYIWWYAEKSDSNIDKRVFEQGRLNRERPNDAYKQWIKLGYKNKDGAPQEIVNIAEQGPFILNRLDLGANKSYSLSFKYSSYWTWGGISPRPAHIDDPCLITGTGDRSNLLSVRNPRTARSAALHPWDLDKHGLITEPKLKAILGFSPTVLQGVPGITQNPEVRYRQAASPPSYLAEETEEDLYSSSEESESPLGRGRRGRRKRSRDAEEPLSSDAFSFEEDTAPPLTEIQALQKEMSHLTKKLSREREFRHGLRKRIKLFLSS